MGKHPLFGVFVLLVVDALVLVVYIILIGNMSIKADEVKVLKNTELQGTLGSDTTAVQADVTASQDKIDALRGRFADELGIVSFVRAIDELKRAGVVTEFSFASDEPVTDTLGFSGLPYVVSFTGAVVDIDRALRTMQALPLMQRAITVETQTAESGEGAMTLRYGGILYVQ